MTDAGDPIEIFRAGGVADAVMFGRELDEVTATGDEDGDVDSGTGVSREGLFNRVSLP